MTMGCTHALRLPPPPPPLRVGFGLAMTSVMVKTLLPLVEVVIWVTSGGAVDVSSPRSLVVEIHTELSKVDLV